MITVCKREGRAFLIAIFSGWTKSSNNELMNKKGPTATPLRNSLTTMKRFIRLRCCHNSFSVFFLFFLQPQPTKRRTRKQQRHHRIKCEFFFFLLSKKLFFFLEVLLCFFFFFFFPWRGFFC